MPTRRSSAISEQPSPTHRTDRSDTVFVLVHGSFHGAWCFEKVIPHLTLQGHPVIAQDLPGHGLQARLPRSYLEPRLDPEAFAAEPSPIAEVSLQDCADQVLAGVHQIAERLPGSRIVLVGHSFGGVVLTRVGETVPHLLERLVYVSAFMLPTGDAITDCLSYPEFAGSILPSTAVGDPGAIGAFRINPRSAEPDYRSRLEATFAPDLGGGWEAMANLLTPDTPLAANAEPVTRTAERWGGIPRTYIASTVDRALPLSAQQRFIREADALTPDNPTDVREMATGHSPHLSQPEHLARLLLDV